MNMGHLAIPAYVFFDHRNIEARDYLFFLNVSEHIVGHGEAAHVFNECIPVSIARRMRG